MLATLLNIIKKRLPLAIIAGVLAFAFMFGKTVYNNRYFASARLSFVYDGIENGEYPDGQRFAMLDLVSDELVTRAYENLQKKGFYDDIPLDDVLASVNVSPYLTGSVSLTSARAAGYDYSYYANEYAITYSQPRNKHWKDPSDFFGFFRASRAQELVDEISRLYLLDFLRDHTDNGQGFVKLSQVSGDDVMDYQDLAAYYKEKVQYCLDYLYQYDGDGIRFTSETTGKSLKDLITAFEVLQYQTLEKLSQFIDASYLSKDLQQVQNRYAYDLRYNTLARQKAEDETIATQKAMSAYDHNFTQNLVVVAADDEKGLYQARPKTAYDTITTRAYQAKTVFDHYTELCARLETEMQAYTEAGSNAKAYRALCDEADAMIQNVSQTYDALCQSTLSTVKDYLSFVNNGYFTIRNTTPALYTKSTIVKALVYFAAAAVAVLCGFIALRLAGDYLKKQTARRRAAKQREAALKA